MRRSLMLIAMLGLLGATHAEAAGTLMPPPPASLDETGVDRWVKAHIDDKDWYALSYTDDYIRFFSWSKTTKTDKGQVVRTWIRQEYFKPQGDDKDKIRSALFLTEYDCDLKRYRWMAIDYFPFNNLKGDASSDDAQDVTWAFPRPGTVGEIEMAQICEAINKPAPSATK